MDEAQKSSSSRIYDNPFSSADFEEDMMTSLLLLLPPRLTDGSQTLQRAALALGWRVKRLENWRPAPWLRDEQLVFYGEPLFADVVAGPLGLALLEPTLDWLAQL